MSHGLLRDLTNHIQHNGNILGNMGIKTNPQVNANKMVNQKQFDLKKKFDEMASKVARLDNISGSPDNLSGSPDNLSGSPDNISKSPDNLSERTDETRVFDQTSTVRNNLTSNEMDILVDMTKKFERNMTKEFEVDMTKKSLDITEDFEEEMTTKFDVTPLDADSPIQEFYKDQTVFITGATGFLGTLLVEKLLRSCPGIRRLILLIRKRGKKSVDERVKDYFSDQIFDTMRLSNPNYSSKVTIITGQLDAFDFGLSDSERHHLLSNTSIVLHVAATVRFDQHIRSAHDINVAGTRTALDLARRMPQLKSFVYVSTAYCNCDREYIEEKFYPPVFTADEMSILLESASDTELALLNEHLVGTKPNTYTLTKATAEDLVRESIHDLPVSVFRPSIVFPTLQEPMPLWMKGFNSVLALCVATGIGLIRVSLTNVNSSVDMVPADRTINAIIALAWYRTLNKRKPNGQTKNQMRDMGEIEPNTHTTTPVAMTTTMKQQHFMKTQKHLANAEKRETVLESCENKHTATSHKLSNELEHKESGADSPPPIYNFVSCVDNNVKFGEFFDQIDSHWKESHESNSSTMWPASVYVTANVHVYNFMYLALHFVPAIVFSLAERLTNRPPQVLKYYRRIRHLYKTISYFSLNEWQFVNNNTRTMINAMSPADRSQFAASMGDFHWASMFCVGVHRAVSIYMLNDPPTKEYYNKRTVYLEWLDYCMRTVIKGIAVYVVLGVMANLINHCFF